jgi:hypothetical protein
MENSADCGRFEEEYQIISSEKHSKEQTHIPTTK